jgi:CRISPR-associated protein Csb2
MSDLALVARFPFGRYAATPWFRSRREHVGNVEWPPSPWRLVRALLAAAHATADDLDAVLSLLRLLAAANPRFELPKAAEIGYTQWMPQLGFDDSPSASERGDNGHTLLSIDPDARMTVRWPRIALVEAEQDLLGRLVDNVRYLGQSVSVCEMTIEDDPGYASWSVARPASEWDVGPDYRTSTRTIRLLVPTPEVTRSNLEISTADGKVKAMPAPLGARWLDYEVREPRVRPTSPAAFARAFVYRLDGDQRPGRATAEGLERRGLSLAILVARALMRRIEPEAVRLVDDDGDGRAERLMVTLVAPVPEWGLVTLLDPPRRLAGPGIDCRLVLESVDWGRAPVPTGLSGPPLVAFRLEGARLPPITEAVGLAEVWRRRMLGVAGRRLGADRIPPRLSGKRPDGRPLAEQHKHLHVLVHSADGLVINTLCAWSQDGFTPAELDVLRHTSLPLVAGAPIALLPGESQLIGPSRNWTSHTPFLPPLHQKRRGGRWVPTFVDQLCRELRLRGLPEPQDIEDAKGAWLSFRLIRRGKPGANPSSGAHGFTLRFPEPVRGPIALGRNSHFGMGLFVPVE